MCSYSMHLLTSVIFIQFKEGLFMFLPEHCHTALLLVPWSSQRIHVFFFLKTSGFSNSCENACRFTCDAENMGLVQHEVVCRGVLATVFQCMEKKIINHSQGVHMD
jgi:hypothetical protein